MADLLDFLSGTDSELYVRQQNNNYSITPDFDVLQKYVAYSTNGEELGFICFCRQRYPSLFSKYLPKSWHSIRVIVLNKSGSEMFRFQRVCFLSFAKLSVIGSNGLHLGEIFKSPRLGSSNCSLFDTKSFLFASANNLDRQKKIFPVYNKNQKIVAGVNKKWEGLAHDIFSNTDSYCVYFGDKTWSLAARSTMLALAITFGYDYF